LNTLCGARGSRHTKKNLRIDVESSYKCSEQVSFIYQIVAFGRFPETVFVLLVHIITYVSIPTIAIAVFQQRIFSHDSPGEGFFAFRRRISESRFVKLFRQESTKFSQYISRQFFRQLKETYALPWAFSRSGMSTFSSARLSLSLTGPFSNVL